MSPRILVVDGHRKVRQAFRSLLEREGLDVVGEASKGEEAHRLARELLADVVVLGFTRPLENCLSVAGEILRMAPRAGVILVAFEDYLFVRALQTGIRGYVLRTRVVEELPEAIRAVARGSTYVSPCIPSALVEACLASLENVPSGA